MIEARDLSYSYKRNGEYAVRGVSFRIEKGEIFGFLGPSGAGKSTTIGILSGLLELQEGQVLIGGAPRKARPGKEFFNRIGVGFEIPNVYKKLSGYDNLKFHASLYDGPTDDPLETLKAVGLLPEARKAASTYSKGMRQRLGFARSMINRPELWFLDEPTMGLDPATAGSIKGIIRRRRDEGATVFLTTHNMFVADELCDRVAFLVDGRIAAMDSPKNLKLRYGLPRVTVEYMEGGELRSENFGLEGEDRARLQACIGERDVRTVHSGEPTLEEIFIRLTGRALE